LNGGLGRTAVCHFDEAKAPGTPGVLVGNETDSIHLAIWFEELAEFIFRGAKRQIANKDIHRHVLCLKHGDTIARSSEQYAGVKSKRNMRGETAKTSRGLARQTL